MAYDKTKFLSGMAMGLTGKGDPIFERSDKQVYNGVTLPEFESAWEYWNENDAPFGFQCPYGLLVYNANENLRVKLWVAAYPWYYDGSKVYSVDSTGVGTYYNSFIHRTYKNYAGFYWHDSDSGLGQSVELNPEDCFWASHDIINTADGSVFLAASEPTEDAFTKGYLAGAALRRKRVIVGGGDVSADGLVSADGYTLLDINGLNLIPKEGN